MSLCSTESPSRGLPTFTDHWDCPEHSMWWLQQVLLLSIPQPMKGPLCWIYALPMASPGTLCRPRHCSLKVHLPINGTMSELLWLLHTFGMDYISSYSLRNKYSPTRRDSNQRSLQMSNSLSQHSKGCQMDDSKCRFNWYEYKYSESCMIRV